MLYPNIDKSAFRPGEYTGYAARVVWHIRQHGPGDWRAVPHHGDGLALQRTIYGATLGDISRTLADRI